MAGRGLARLAHIVGVEQLAKCTFHSSKSLPNALNRSQKKGKRPCCNSQFTIERLLLFSLIHCCDQILEILVVQPFGGRWLTGLAANPDGVWVMLELPAIGPLVVRIYHPTKIVHSHAEFLCVFTLEWTALSVGTLRRSVDLFALYHLAPPKR